MRRVIITAALAAIIAAGTAGCSTGGLPTASCGQVETEVANGGAPVLGLATGPQQPVYRCFDTAAATCTAASIRVHVKGIDFDADDVYAIAPGGIPAHCTVTDYYQFSSINFGGTAGAVLMTRCRTTSVPPNGATITCPGEPPIVIPA
jgi:hypothetical protein